MSLKVIAQTEAQLEVQQAITYYEQQNYEQAIILFEKHLEIVKQVFQNKPSTLSAILSAMADCYDKTQKPELAKKFRGDANNLLSISPDTPEDWQGLYQRGMQSFQNQQFKIAADWFKKALPKAEQQFGKQHSNYASTLNNIAQSLMYAGEYKEAEPYYLECKAIDESTVGKNHAFYALSCFNLAQLYLRMGKHQEAEPLYLECKSIQEKVIGKNNTAYANTLNDLGEIEKRKGSFTQAENYFLVCKNIREQLLGKNHPDYAIILNNLAGLYDLRGQLIEAEKYYIECLLIQEKTIGKNHSDYLTTLNNLGNVYRILGKYQKAENLYLTYQNIQKRILGENHPTYATTLQNLGSLYHSMGYYAKAEELYFNCLRIRENKLGKNHPDYASTLNSLGVLNQAMGRYSQAEDFFLEAVSILDKNPNRENTKLYNNLINNAAILYNKMGKTEQSEKLYLQAKASQSALFGVKHPDYSGTLYNLGVLYLGINRLDKALSHLQEAKMNIIENFGKEHPDYARVLNALAILYSMNKDEKQAEIMYSEALSIQEKTLGNTHPEYITTVKNIAVNYFSNQLFDKAEPFFIKAIELKITEMDMNLFYSSEEEQKQYSVTNQSFFEDFKTFAINRFKENKSILKNLFSLQMSIKGYLLNNQIKIRNAIFNSKDSILLAKFQNFQHLRNQIAKAYTLKPKERQERGINIEEFKKVLNQLEKDLVSATQKLNENYNIQIPTWENLQTTIKPNEAAIEIIRTRYFYKKRTDSVLYIALIVKPETKEQPEMVVLPNGKELEDKYFRTYQNSIQSKLRDDKSYSRYWQPLVDKIGNVKKIYFSGDGIYNQLNISTLYNPNTQKYVLEEMDIQLVGNTKELVKRARAKPSKSLPNSAVLLGRPQYDLSAEAHLQASKNYRAERDLGMLSMGDLLKNTQLSDLEGTETEVRNIQTYLKQKGWQTELYIQANAVEEVVKKVKYPRVLHIATHGFFFNETQAFQVADTTTYMGGNDDLAIKFSNEDRTDRKTQVKQQAQIEAMLRSGVVLAGVSTYAKAEKKYATEDGILTAYEAMNLDLDNTELVVLSACETGLGDVVAGEGVYGLQRAFQQAGAKTVLISLWKVSDEATQLLMRTFYENWLQGKTKREAFRLAQDKLKSDKEYQNPYFWGAFVMVGE